MSQINITKQNKVVRGAKRANYDVQTIFSIVDAATICHVGTSMNQKTILIPTIHGRKNDTLYIHGSNKSRMVQALTEQECCLVFSIVDGLVLARSAFHHSMNYRSVVAYGTFELVKDYDEKYDALNVITDHVLPGRWEEVRRPNQKEMEITSVLKMTLDQASAKIRTGDPVDDQEDYALPIWAGTVPYQQHIENAVPDTKLDPEIKIPQSVLNLYK